MSLPFRRAIACLVPSVCGTLPPREGGLRVRLAHRAIAHAMAKQLPCHRMCCGPDTLLWFALSVFRVADMTGIDGHVSFLPQKNKEKKVGLIACLDGLPRLLCACRLRRKGLATRQGRAFLASAGDPPLMYPLDVTHVVLRRWRAGVWGSLDPRVENGAGAPACLRR